jgi:hypothetical protein
VPECNIATGVSKQLEFKDDRIGSYVSLVKAVDEGRLDCLVCPDCYRGAVSAWFTEPAEDEYRFWFLCTECEFHSRAHCVEKPRFFSEDRRRMDLEERDSSIFKNAIFRRPEDQSAAKH